MLAETVIRCGDTFTCHGTSGPDLIKGTDANNGIEARGGNDVVRSRGGNDFLEGQGGNDELRGGEDRDYVEGGPGRDALVGGAGGDSYEIRADPWGRDSLVDAAVPDSDITTGNDLYIAFTVNEALVVNVVSGPGSEVRNTFVTGTIDWEGDAIDNVYGFGRGGDTITGNDKANLLAGFGGYDAVRGGGGDDYIRVDDGSGGDVVSCGEDGEGVEDNDVVYRDPPDPETGDPGDDIAADCEAKEDPIVYETHGALLRTSR